MSRCCRKAVLTLERPGCPRPVLIAGRSDPAPSVWGQRIDGDRLDGATGSHDVSESRTADLHEQTCRAGHRLRARELVPAAGSHPRRTSMSRSGSTSRTASRSVDRLTRYWSINCASLGGSRLGEVAVDDETAERLRDHHSGFRSPYGCTDGGCAHLSGDGWRHRDVSGHAALSLQLTVWLASLWLRRHAIVS
jgi:hypothetical protein